MDALRICLPILVNDNHFTALKVVLLSVPYNFAIITTMPVTQVETNSFHVLIVICFHWKYHSWKDGTTL